MADDQSMETNEQSSTNAPKTSAGANSATADEDDRKLFAGGLPQEAGEEDINEHFSQYGEIESVNLKTGMRIVFTRKRINFNAQGSFLPF